METTKIRNVERVDMILERWGTKIDALRSGIFGTDKEKATLATKLVLHELQIGLSNELRRKGYLMELSKLKPNKLTPTSDGYHINKFKLELACMVLSAYAKEEINVTNIGTKETLAIANNFVKELEKQIKVDREMLLQNDYKPF